MEGKEKIELLKKYLQDSKNIILPSELRAEVSIQANTIGIGGDMGGALTCLRELQREERDNEIIKIQRNQIEFTRILALATTVLALGIFIELIIRLFENPSIILERSSFIEFVLVFLPILVIVLITIELIRVFWLKKGWRNGIK